MGRNGGEKKKKPLQARLSEPRRKAYISIPWCQVPNGLSICKLCALPHQGWLSSHVSFLELGIRSDQGTWAVLEADITETLSIRKTKKSYPQRRKILGEAAREEHKESNSEDETRGERG